VQSLEGADLLRPTSEGEIRRPRCRLVLIDMDNFQVKGPPHIVYGSNTEQDLKQKNLQTWTFPVSGDSAFACNSLIAKVPEERYGKYALFVELTVEMSFKKLRERNGHDGDDAEMALGWGVLSVQQFTSQESVLSIPLKTGSPGFAEAVKGDRDVGTCRYFCSPAFFLAFV